MVQFPDDKELQSFALDAGIAPDVVRAVHAREWQKLEGKARIKAFLPLLVMKHVREHFHHAAASVAPADNGDAALH